MHLGDTAVLTVAPVANQGNHLQPTFAMRQGPPPADWPHGSVDTLSGHSDAQQPLISRDHPIGSPCDERDSPPTGADRIAHTALSMGSTSSRASLLHVWFVLSSACSLSICSLLISLFFLFLLSAYTPCQALFSIQQKTTTVNLA